MRCCGNSGWASAPRAKPLTIYRSNSRPAALLRKGHIGGEGLMRARLAGWMPALIDGCIALDPDGFYGGLARLLGNLNLLEAPGPDGQPHLVSVIDGQDGSHHVE
jgi:TorA-specific chaperone